MPSARAPRSSATRRATTPRRTGSRSRRWRESRRAPLSRPGIAGTAKGSSATAARRRAAADAGSGAGTTFSTTNNQEAGVDEPDIAKTDGSTIFTLAQDKLEAVSVTGAAPKLVGTLDLGTAGANAQLLLYGNRVLVVSTPSMIYAGLPPIAASLRASPYWAYGSQTVITEVDVHDPSAMAVTQTMSVDGRFVDARQSGSSARIVIASAPAGDRRAAARRGGIGLGPVLAVQGRSQRPPFHASGRVVRDDPPARPVLRARDGEHRHRELREGAAGGAVDLTDGRRADRVRIADEPLHRDPEVGYADAVGRPASRVAGHRDRQVRRQRSRHDHVPLERRGARLPAQPVLALRERRVPARREHEPADLVGPGPADDQPELRDRPPAAGRRSRARSARYPGSVRASRSTPCGSSATPDTSSRSTRSTRCTRST